MNYYERHLGDYARDTGHLSPLEHGIYTLLLDRYYATEAGIPVDQAHRICRARSKEEREAVDAVLGEFFSIEDGVYRQARVEQEIDKARARIEVSKSNGKRGGRPRKNPVGFEMETQTKPSGFSPGFEMETQTKAHHTPDTRKEEQKLPSSLRSDSSSPNADDPSPPPPDDRPADLASRHADRLAQVTDDAITAFNASPLVKSNGGMLASVSTTVGREKRQAQVRRCLRTARAICAERYGGPTVVPEFWADVFAEYARDDFHAGRQRGGKGHENWLPDFEFLTREDVLLRLYDRAASEDAA